MKVIKDIYKAIIDSSILWIIGGIIISKKFKGSVTKKGIKVESDNSIEKLWSVSQNEFPFCQESNQRNSSYLLNFSTSQRVQIKARLKRATGADSIFSDYERIFRIGSKIFERRKQSVKWWNKIIKFFLQVNGACQTIEWGKRAHGWITGIEKSTNGSMGDIGGRL